MSDRVRVFDRATDWVVDRPLPILLLLILLTGLAYFGYTDPERITGLFASNSAEHTDDDAPANVRFRTEPPPDVDPLSLTAADAVLVVHSDSFFTTDGVESLRRVVKRIESLDYVDSVLWMDRIPILNVFGLQEPLFPRSVASETRFEAARERALAHPLVGGQLLSADGKTLLLLVKFEWLFVTSDDDCTVNLPKVAEAAAAEYPGPEMTFRVTGRVPLYVTAMQVQQANQLKYQMIGYGMIALMALILFRGISAVLIVAIAPSLGVFWTLGILRYFDWHNNPFNDVVLPVLLSLVGLTDGVHLMVQIRRLRASGLPAREAARQGVREVGLACGLTSLTTAIGFGSLSLAHHDLVREFGYCCVLGVALTFLAVITSIPLACSTWLGRNLHVGHNQGLVDRHLGRVEGLVEFVLKRTRAISWLGIGITTLFVLISLTLRPDERNANAVPTHSEAAIGMREMDRALGGLEFGSVDLQWSESIDTDSPEVLEVVSKIDDILRAEPLIGHPISIRNLVDSLPGEGSYAARMTMIELLPAPLKRAFYTPEYRQASVGFRVQDLGIAKYGPVFERIELALHELMTHHPEFTFELSGSAIWRWRNLYQIVVDLAASLGSASLVIFLVLALVYRSFRIGLISVIPNLFPLAVTGAFLVLTGQALELVSVCAFTVCLGIAVDDTIHFLTRFEAERRRTDDQDEAIRRAFTAVGTALIMTTVILVAGFSTVLLSDARDHRIFAAMGGLTIAAALFGDLVFLPALLSHFARPRK